MVLCLHSILPLPSYPLIFPLIPHLKYLHPHSKWWGTDLPLQLSYYWLLRCFVLSHCSCHSSNEIRVMAPWRLPALCTKISMEASLFYSWPGLFFIGSLHALQRVLIYRIIVLSQKIVCNWEILTGNSVMIFSPSCRSKTVWLCFFCRT